MVKLTMGGEDFSFMCRPVALVLEAMANRATRWSTTRGMINDEILPVWASCWAILAKPLPAGGNQAPRGEHPAVPYAVCS